MRTPGDRTVHPTFIYGTAWKQEATTSLVVKAVKAGFRAIDTANQPRHYSEALVGDALEILAREGIGRGQLILQTKFTPLDGHDNRVPYDPKADLPAQVRQSFASSLEHLRTDYVDSYLLHGPYSHPDLGPRDWKVWEAIGEFYKSGTATTIGVSNVNAGQLADLVKGASVKPMMVQNRCYANRGWDREVRRICRDEGILYQGFSLLTANVPVLRHPPIVSIAQRLGVEPAQVIFRFARQVGMVPLTGTSDERHMLQDLAIEDIELTPEEVGFIESVAG